MDDILTGLLWYVVLLFSLTFHEAAHAWAALRGGDSTAYLGGQVSLDPTPHIRREPVGTVIAPWLFYLWGGWMIGWASTPFDPVWASHHPRRAAWMAAAGPAANALLVLTAAGAVRLGLAAGVFEAPASIGFAALTGATRPGVWETLATLVSLLFTLNLLLLVFNLIPVPPLDGGGVLGIFLDDQRARRLQAWMAQPMVALGGILVAWFLIGRVFGPVHRAAVNLLYPGLHYG